MKIPIFNTYIHSDAKKIVGDVLESTFLSEGKIVKKFEAELSSKLGILNPVTVNSGTSALHLALVLAGVGEGDEVILPSQTFIATGSVVLQQKATPIFADIDYHSGNISVDSIKNKITLKTKAIIVVHWGGYPCDMDEIIRLATENNIMVIEDAAHALGSTYKKKVIGEISDFTCFSFQAIKNLTTGDGGAVSCKKQDKYKKALMNRWFGIDRVNAKPSLLGERVFDIKDQGFKYHLNDYSAALGLANLEGFKKRLKNRQEIAKFYIKELSEFNGISLFNYHEDRKSAYWLFGFHVEKREQFILALKSKGITASVIHQGIDKYNIFGGVNKRLFNQRKFDKTQIHIPIHDAVGIEEASYIIEQIKLGWI